LRNLVFNPETPSFENSETLMGKYGRRWPFDFKILNWDYLAKIRIHLENRQY
jgi:hypothetical protein